MQQNRLEKNEKSYELVLSQGINFSSPKEIKTIYDHFNIVYYFTDIYKMTLHSLKIHQGVKSAKVTFQGNGQYYFHEVSKDICYDEGEENFSQKCIKYKVNKDEKNYESGSQINVHFRVDRSYNFKNILIKIVDESQWIKNNLKSEESKINGQRNYQSNILTKSGQLQYFYKEPQDQRTVKIQKQHFGIVLQGGGVKGIAYIGAYEGLLQQKGTQVQKSITSIMGSSAGGILSLAFCCEMETQQLYDICKQIGDIPKNDKIQYSPGQEFNEEMKKYKTRLGSIQQFLISYGILGEDLIQEIQLALSDRNFEEAIINLLKVSQGQEIASLLTNSHKGRQELDFSRLLSAGLMKGEAIKTIGQQCLKNVFTDKTDEELAKVTMKELYDKKQKEFTCTTVDLDDQIIRFLNHKTTPHLPVVYAVQMTGSFPVAFKAQKWKKQWGKYYIHYQNIRREIDLTGHQFTDGGMLANFPIKYLDNEKMRPMYFSHPRTQKTQIFGFGLNSIPDPEYNKEKEQKVNKQIQKVKEALGNYAGCCKIFSVACKGIGRFCSNLCGTNEVQKQLEFHGQDEEYQLKSVFENLPLTKFGLRLLDTYMNASDNFIRECFEKQLFHTSLKNGSQKKGINYEKQKYNHFEYRNSIRNIVKEVSEILLPDELSNNDEQKLYSFAKKIVLKQISDQREKLKVIQTKNRKQSHIIEVAVVLNELISEYYMARKIMNSWENEQKDIQFFRKSLIFLDDMLSGKHFYRQSILINAEQLLQICDFFQKYFQRSQKNKNIKLALKNCLQKSLNQAKGITDKFKKYTQILFKKQNSERKTYKALPQYITFEWLQLARLTYLLNSSKKNQIQEKVYKNLKVNQLAIIEHTRRNKNFLRNYTHSMLRKQISSQEKSVHLVLESKNISELYFNEYIQICKQSILTFNKNNSLEDGFSIKSITSSNYHSIAAFLHASNLQKKQINEFCWRIKDSISLIDEKDLSQNFESYKWTQLINQKMRQLEEETWKNRFNIFEHLDKQLLKEQDIDIEIIYDQMNGARIAAENSKDMMNDAFENTLNFIGEQLSQAKSLNKTKDKIRQIFGVQGQQNYKKLDKKKNEMAQKFYKQMFHKFEDIIKFLIYASPNILNPIFQNLTEEERKIAWKGLILCQALSSLKIKNLIREILSKTGLPLNITMKEFYEFSPNKIQLNFMAVESITNTITVINYLTRPNMPVWAAILATSSLPYFSKNVTDHKQWRNSEFANQNIEAETFFQKNNIKHEYLQSANNLSKIPLELITNMKIRNLITKRKDEVFLAFSFDDLQFKKKHHPVKAFKSKPIDLWTVAKWRFFNDFSFQFFQIPAIAGRFNELNLYIESHDNLILSIYKKESVLFPLELGTLDFGRVTAKQKNQVQIGSYESKYFKSNSQIQNLLEKDIKVNEPMKKMIENDNDELSELTLKTIRTAKYAIIQKLRNNDKNQERMMYIQFRYIKKDKTLKIIFPLNPSKKYLPLPQKYRVYYRLQKEDFMSDFLGQVKYERIQSECVNIQFSEEKPKQIYFKIAYPVRNKKNQSYEINFVYQKISFEKFSFDKDSFDTYELNFNKVHYKSIEKPSEKTSLNMIQIESYNQDLWSEVRSCPSCKSQKFKAANIQQIFKKQYHYNKQIGKTHHFKLLTIQYECLNCGYHIYPRLKIKNNNIICPFNHDFDQIQNRQNMKEQDSIQYLRMCCFCKNYEQIIFKDSKCNITICSFCRSRLFLID